MIRSLILPLALVLILASSRLFAQDRVALLVANSDYGEYHLPDAKSDVGKLAKMLESAGFAVTVKENVRKSFREDLEKFVVTCPNGGVSLFYFSGFGTRYQRKLSRNVTKADGTKDKEYYFETDSGIWATEAREPYRLEDLARIYRERSHARLNFFLFDCGLRFPKVDAKSQGLLEVQPNQFPSGVVCYAMPPEEALPVGTRSVFSECILRGLAKKDATLGDVMATLRDQVAKHSKGRQTLWHRYGLQKDAEARVISSRIRNLTTSKLPPSNPKPGDEWINGSGMVFCWCPPGSFRMGIGGGKSPQTRDAEPVDVVVSRGFWISKYEVTNGDYRRARNGKNPLGSTPISTHANVPLTHVDGLTGLGWGAKHLEPQERKAGCLPDGWTYRLPTEAEWEYACRAGATSRFSFGNSKAELYRFANYADEALYSVDDSFYYCDRGASDAVGKRPAPIGCFEPNAWGIHDMHGNASEYVLDKYVGSLAGGTDPLIRPDKNGSIVCRGGSWCSLAEYCQSGFRNSMSERSRNLFQGFRVVLAKK